MFVKPNADPPFPFGKHNCYFPGFSEGDPDGYVMAWDTGITNEAWQLWAYVPPDGNLLKENVLEALTLWLSSDDNDTQRQEKAIHHILNSLDYDLWRDGWHLTKKGEKVFKEEEKAVKELMKIDDQDISDMIASLVGIDRDLALAAIYEARQQLGDDKEIDKAEKEMKKAEKEIE